MREPRLLLTCEHASNRVPARLRGLFPPAGGILETHRGLDVGALPVARRLSRSFRAPLISGPVSRLVVDLNRSPHHRNLFSEYTRDLQRAVRDEILTRYYHPYRDAVEAWIARHVRAGRRVLHLSIHSFTPVLRGERRRADLGLLYDPARPCELALCRRWKEALAHRAPGLRVRRNYPYRGTDDGLIPKLRRRFPARLYAGVEIEMNQGRLRRDARAIRAAVERSLGDVLGRA